MDSEEVYIRKSPAILAVKIAIAEITTELLYSLLHFTLYYFADQIEGDLALLSGLLNIAMSVVAILLFTIIVAMWAAEGVLITKSELVYKYGIINGHHRSYPFMNIQRVEVQQGMLGRLLNFGTVIVHLPVLSEDIRFQDMSNPNAFARQLKESIIRPGHQQYLIKK